MNIANQIRNHPIPRSYTSNLSNEDTGPSLTIYFEPMSMDGLQEMHAYSLDARLYEFFEFPPFTKLEKTRDYIQRNLDRVIAGTGLYWFVRDGANKKLVGSCCLVTLDFTNRSVEWGFGVDPKLWGKGYILLIQEALKQYVFDTLHFNRLHGKTMITNQRTINGLLAAGFRHEATLRDYYRKNDAYIDAWLYAMTSDDYSITNLAIETKNIISIEAIVEIISVVLTSESISEESSMDNSETWDSLNHMNIIMEITEKVGVKFTPAEIAAARSAKLLVAIINSKFH